MEDKFEELKTACQQKDDLDQKRIEDELNQIKNFNLVDSFFNLFLEKKTGNKNEINSLVAFALNLTSEYPKGEFVLHKRLKAARISPPDIDLDFTDRRRDEVIKYVSEKYGQDHVAQIITFGTMAARAVIRDVGRATNLPYSFCDQTAKMIPPGMTLTETLDKVQEFRQLYDTDEQARNLIDFAKKLEGCARHASTHACGVVISKEPLDEIVPLQFPTQTDKNIIITQYEMHAIEDLGILKMDFLGLKNLTIIEDALARIYKVKGLSIDLTQIPQDDKKTFELFQKAQTTSVFQLESGGMKRYLKDLKPNTFDDITTMVALYRPGPIELIPDYIARKHHRKEVQYIHPSLEPVLEKTFGLPVFQEQIMQIARVLAGFSLSEADILRKAIGKKIKALLDAQKEKFIDGCLRNNVSRAVAEKVFSWVEPHASYSFNKSHAVAYAMIAYNTAYLKAHFPVEFMAAVLTSEKADVERIAFLIEECKEMKIEVLAPDVNESYRNFSVTPEGDKIRFGLLAIKNVGENIVDAILNERKQNGPFQSFSDFVSRIDNKDFNKKSMEALIKSGTFDKFEERNRLLENLEDVLSFNREIRKTKTGPQPSLFGGLGGFSIAPAGLKLKEAPELDSQQKLLWEKELLGLYVSSHPLHRVKNILAQRAMSLKELKEETFVPRVRVGGIISNIKKIITKKGQPMLFVKLEDLTGKAEVIVFPGVLEQNAVMFQENKIVFITGKVDRQGDEPKIICEGVEEIIEI